MTDIPSDMRAGLDAFDKIRDAALRQFINQIEAKSPPRLIYHYTDDAGLKGILQSGTFWLTSVWNLNDPEELRHGFSHAISALNARARHGPPESKIFARQFERFLVDRGIEAVAHYFVCCFSTAGDDLGQWRAYADNGRGYALAFDRSLLEDAFTKASVAHVSNNSTFYVTYDDAQALSIQAGTIDAAIPLISSPHGRNLDSASLHEYMDDLLTVTWLHCLRAALFFKHEAYANEAEYRLFQIHAGAPNPAPAVKYRTRPYELVKYREFDWRTAAAGALAKTVVGPAANQAKATQYAKDCLRAFHPGEKVEVVFSKIPYRS